MTGIRLCQQPGLHKAVQRAFNLPMRQSFTVKMSQDFLIGTPNRLLPNLEYDPVNHHTPTLKGCQ